MTLPADIAREAQKLATDRLVKLYEIDATDLGGGLFRFVSSVDATMKLASLTRVGVVATGTTETNHTLATGDSIRITDASQPEFVGDFVATVTGPKTFTYTMSAIPLADSSGAYHAVTRLNNTMVFDGHDYIPIAVNVSGFEWNGQGTLPTPVLQISNVNRVLASSVNSLKSLVGAKFTRIRTFRKHLDDGSDPDPTLIFPKEIYRVNRKTAQNKVYIEFQLASALDQEGVKIPGRICLRNTCTHRYRVWDATTLTFDYTQATCPYVGSTYFTANNVVAGDPALDRCGKTLASCRARFGTAPLPTRAVPGIGGR